MAEPNAQQGAGPQTEELFHGALRLPAGERKAFLDEACAGDPGRRAALASLLNAHEDSGDFLTQPAMAHPTQVDPAQAVGTLVGPYELLEVLGEGGFGVVYRALQRQPVEREVALKVIKLGMDTRQVIARFEAERQALALTDHTHIARVLDAGATAEGRPYFVMELVRGVGLCEYCDRHALSIPERLRLFVEVCRGVQHAHQKGLIHRDLKPSNVLVVEEDGRPVPKLIDFGVAKATRTRGAAGTAHTELGQFVGTPSYMSPEQAGLSGLDVDTRADIYSLGAMLYELLCGQTPFDGRRLRESSLLEVQRILAEELPLPPSQRTQPDGTRDAEACRRAAAARRLDPHSLSGALRGDLNWITMCALEKERDRRYAAAEGLARDLLRHLEHRPVTARPPGTWYLLRKFTQRNRLKVVAATAVVLAIFVGTSLAGWYWREAVVQRDRATGRSAFVETLMVGQVPPADLIREAQETFGEDHGAVAAAMGLGAEQMLARGDLSAAAEFERRALETWRSVHGEQHLTVAESLGRLGAILKDLGDIDGAEQHLSQALAIEGSLASTQSPTLLAVRANLAAIHRRRGRLGPAATLLREVVATRRELFPHQQEALGRALEDLGNVLTAAGQDEEAAQVKEEEIEAYQSAYPEGAVISADRHMDVGIWLYGAWIGGARRLRDAEQHLRTGLLFYADNPQIQGRQYLTGLLALATLLQASDDQSAEALQLVEQALDLAQQLHGPTSLEYARLEWRLAQACDLRGDYVRAGRLYRHSYTSRAAALGTNFRPADAALAFGGFARKIAQRRDASAEAYGVAAELVELMILHAPDRPELLDLYQQLLQRLKGTRSAESSKDGGGK